MTKVPAELPAGPLPDTRGTWNHEYCPDDQRLATAFRNWYDKAQTIWKSLLISNAEHKDPRFRWEPATGRLACPQAAASPTSDAMRTVAMKIDEAARLLGKGKPPSKPAIIDHMRKLNVTLSRHKFVDDESLKPGMLAWAANVNRAAEAGDSQKLKQLQEVVAKNA